MVESRRKRAKHEFASCGPPKVVAILGHRDGLWGPHSNGRSIAAVLQMACDQHGLGEFGSADIGRGETMLFGIALVRWQFGIDDHGTLAPELIVMRAAAAAHKPACKFLEHHVLHIASLRHAVCVPAACIIGQGMEEVSAVALKTIQLCLAAGEFRYDARGPC